jgi:hypothetical protein
MYYSSRVSSIAAKVFVAAYAAQWGGQSCPQPPSGDCVEFLHTGTGFLRVSKRFDQAEA